MRFLTIGAGALGGYYGGMLLKGGADVAFLVRPRRAAQLAKCGLVIRRTDGEFRTPVKTVTAGVIDGSYDVALLACKAYDLTTALDDLAPVLSPGGAVLPILNGINHIETLVARFGRKRVLGGVGMVNAELLPEGAIAFRLAGDNHISYGELDEQRSGRCEEIRAAFAAGGVPSAVSDRIVAEMWGKFCAYAAVAVLATLTRARAGEVAAVPSGAAFVAAAFAECAQVIAAEGYPPPPEIGDFVRGLYARLGSDYRPSIAVDLEAGRPTEGEHTIGDLVHRADRRGVEVPILRAALCSLQIHEARRRVGLTSGS
jgi:2-dehydropantoate 2-reductase